MYTSTAFRTGLISLLMATASLSVMAQPDAYPSKPISLVVPSPSGGDTDVLARRIAEKLSLRLKQSVVVINRPGAANTIGTAYVAKSSPDGYTLVVAPSTIAIAPSVMSGAKYSVTDDLTPVVQLVHQDLLVVTNAGTGLRNMKQLVEATRKGGITYATPGSGSPMHIVGELINASTTTKMAHVPYKGLAPAISDLLGGHVSVLITTLGPVEQHIRSGKFVALAVVGSKRSEALPNVPTLTEQGIGNVNVDSWQALFGPKGMPASLVTQLNRQVNEILRMPEVVADLKTQYMTPVGGEPIALQALVANDYARYAKLVKEFGISAD